METGNVGEKELESKHFLLSKLRQSIENVISMF